MAYIVWPLALFDAVRPAPEATAWSRLHSRQAFIFGLLGTLAYLFLLAIPLLVVIAVPGIALGVVVWVYAVGLLADVIGAFTLFGLALTYRERALRGELFAIPLVTPLIDRFFPLER
ncbi:MAG TPA: hypothetical protein VMA36_14810 [Candidatus Limnocylindria bacterium]|nr:hypothetical protein [Candidatus Limnocylindria bacterium]